MPQISELPGWALRLRQALDASRSALADLYVQMGLPANGGWLAEALDGRFEPSVDDYAVLSAHTKIPLSFLVGSVHADRSLAMALRSGILEDTSEVQVAAERARTVVDDLKLLLSWFPEAATERKRLAGDARRARSGDAYAKRAGEMTAQGLRAVLELDDDPVDDVVEVVEGLGVPVLTDILPDRIHGVMARDEGNGRALEVIIINVADSWGRQRYSLAHELCHLLYDDGDALVVDHKGPIDENDLTEFRADVFASNFLAPPSAVRRFWRQCLKSRDDKPTSLAKFMLHFGMSREASLNTLSNVVGAAKSEFPSHHELSNQALAERAGLHGEWQSRTASAAAVSPSPWLLSLALQAYGNGLVRPDVVARQLGRPDIDGVEWDLAERGWLQGS